MLQSHYRLCFSQSVQQSVTSCGAAPEPPLCTPLQTPSRLPCTSPAIVLNQQLPPSPLARAWPPADPLSAPPPTHLFAQRPPCTYHPSKPCPPLTRPYGLRPRLWGPGNFNSPNGNVCGTFANRVSASSALPPPPPPSPGQGPHSPDYMAHVHDSSNWNSRHQHPCKLKTAAPVPGHISRGPPVDVD